MLQYTTIENPRPSFGLIVHHTDDEREYAYDGIQRAAASWSMPYTRRRERGWTVASMKDDWKTIFPFEPG